MLAIIDQPVNVFLGCFELRHKNVGIIYQGMMLPEVGFVAQFVGTRDDHDAVFPFIIDGDDSRSCRFCIGAEKMTHIYIGRYQTPGQLFAGVVFSHRTEKNTAAAQLSDGAGLIRTFPAGDLLHAFCRDGFSFLGHLPDPKDQVHI